VAPSSVAIQNDTFVVVWKNAHDVVVLYRTLTSSTTKMIVTKPKSFTGEAVIDCSNLFECPHSGSLLSARQCQTILRLCKIDFNFLSIHKWIFIRVINPFTL
jgi:hypothetical protein